jgi:UDP-N-acetylmuramate: L-alanyl-gamma-D-glutamyl-meso-diaminopimelate ligase
VRISSAFLIQKILSMHIHILGICGTFMGSLALIARSLGHTVTGSDAGIYPPMSTQLQAAGVEIQEGYLASHLDPAPDLVIVGNAMKRGIEAVEYMLDQGLPYTSGPQFLAEHVLQSRHVLAVAGTHGKTTTTTMLAWILQFAGIDTGFLIGGVPLVDTEDSRLQKAFAHSSHLGAAEVDGKRGYFVIEADEYDSAFFDKRSKFVHYRPSTAILNNLEFDHADIFADLNAIQTQFHHMIRMIPSTGQIIMPASTPSLEATLDKGHWTPVWRTQLTDATGTAVIDSSVQESTADVNNSPKIDWQAQLLQADGSHFRVVYQDADSAGASQETAMGEVQWGMNGLHNVNNALVAVAAAYDVGVSIETACAALSAFAGIKRRMELIGTVTTVTGTVQVYDDFAHHPTAITTTLDGAKKKLAGAKLWAIIEPRSNTMKLGIHKDSLAASATLADEVLWYEPAGLEWGLNDTITQSLATTAATSSNSQQVLSSTDDIIDYVSKNVGQNDAIVIMSNGGFEGIHQRLLHALQKR